MTSLYFQTIPVYIGYLRKMSALLEKGRVFAVEKGISEEDFLQIPHQVQSCSNTAKWAAVRLGGMQNEVLEDNETTFKQLQTRIERTIGILDTLKPDCMDGMADKEILMETRIGNFKFATGASYVSEYAIPKFHFHLTACYCIMRRLGVPIDLPDYLTEAYEKV